MLFPLPDPKSGPFNQLGQLPMLCAGGGIRTRTADVATTFRGLRVYHSTTPAFSRRPWL